MWSHLSSTILPHITQGQQAQSVDRPWCSWLELPGPPTCEVWDGDDTVMETQGCKGVWGMGKDERQGQGQWTSGGGSYWAKSPGKLRIHTGLNRWIKYYASGPKLQSRLSSPEEITESAEHWGPFWASILSNWTPPVSIPTYGAIKWQVRQKDSQMCLILFCEPKYTEHIVQSHSFTWYLQGNPFPPSATHSFTYSLMQ